MLKISLFKYQYLGHVTIEAQHHFMKQKSDTEPVYAPELLLLTLL